MSIGMGVTSVFKSATSADTNSTATTLSVAPVKPVNLIRFGFIQTSSTASGTAMVLTLRKRAAFGTGSWTDIATLSPSATVSQGEGLFMDLQSTAADGLADGIDKVNPGEELQVAVTTASGATGTTAQLSIEGVELPFVKTSGNASDDRLGNVTIVDES